MCASDAQLRVATVGGKRRIQGYAAVFNRFSQPLPERGRTIIERIHPRAFDDCLKRCDVRGLVNHDSNLLLGRTKNGTMRLTVDSVGLHYDIDAPDTQVGRDTVVSIERGDMDGSSFSFTVEPGGDSWDDSTSPPIRTVNRVKSLFDVGPVTSPAYLDSTSNVRAKVRSGRRSTEEILDQIADAFHRGVITGQTAMMLRHRVQSQQKNQQKVKVLKLRMGLPIS